MPKSLRGARSALLHSFHRELPSGLQGKRTMEARWRIELLGGLRAQRADGAVARLQRPKVRALLAYLAYYSQHPHPREALIELLWPEIDPEAGRNNLRVTVHRLREQLEPPGTPPGVILAADPAAISLQPAAFTTDVAGFCLAVQTAARLSDAAERAPHLIIAAELYRGELLPGHCEAWVLNERQQLTETYLGALHQLITTLEQEGDLERALEYARRAVSADPLREEAHYDLMRLYAAAGQPSATLHQYQELERLLREELGEAPSAATRAMAEELRQSARTIIVAQRTPVTQTPASPSTAAPARTDPALPTLPVTEGPPGREPGPGAMPPPSWLPVQFSRFFGREEEIARLAETLRVPETRLVTLTGPGGSGKTRLAVAVAGRLLAEFEGGVWFVPLAELTESRRIGEAVRDALGLPASPGGEPLEQVVAALQAGPTLLVLDNYEQLVEEGAVLVRRLLERVPRLTCLVTSRQRLGLEGEHEFVVLPLPTPSGGQPFRRSGVGAEPDLNTLLQYPSVTLFVDRAQAARPGFQLTGENAAAVAALCDRLEGLPLAIELAAARVRVLTPQQMWARLACPAGGVASTRFELLVSRRRDVSARHQSLRAALAWSYQLLPPRVQQFFGRLSIFRGGFTLEAAEAVCSEVALPPPRYRWGGDLLQTAPPRVEDPAVIEYLEHLRECSLVVVEETARGEQLRYGLLETLREFAAEQLSPEEHHTLARRHLHYYMPLAHGERHKASEAKTAAQQQQGLRDVEDEYANLRAALQWGLEHEPAAALWLAAALAAYWSVRGLWLEALEFLPRAAQFRAEALTEMRAKVLRYIGEMAIALGDHQRAQACLEETVALSRWMGEPETVALARVYEGRAVADPEVDRFRRMGAAEYEAAALENLGELAAQQGDYERARALYQESLELRRGLWSPLLTTGPLAGLGHVALAQGDYETARHYYEQSLAIYRATEQQRHEALRLRDLGTVAYCQGQYAQAAEYLQEALATFRAYEDKVGIALTYRGLGDVAVARREYPAARNFYQESLTLLRQVGLRRSVAAVLQGVARLAQTEGEWERAARLLGAVEALREAIGFPRPPHEQPEHEAQLAVLRQRLGEAAFNAAWAAGRDLPWDQAVAEVLGER